MKKSKCCGNEQNIAYEDSKQELDQERQTQKQTGHS